MSEKPDNGQRDPAYEHLYNPNERPERPLSVEIFTDPAARAAVEGIARQLDDRTIKDEYGIPPRGESPSTQAPGRSSHRQEGQGFSGTLNLRAVLGPEDYVGRRRK